MFGGGSFNVDQSNRDTKNCMPPLYLMLISNAVKLACHQMACQDAFVKIQGVAGKALKRKSMHTPEVTIGYERSFSCLNSLLPIIVICRLV